MPMAHDAANSIVKTPSDSVGQMRWPISCATGKSENKFGIPISRAREVYARAARLKGLRVAGVDMHIGSQIVEMKPFDDAFALLSDFVRTLRADGHTISRLDLGGGLGVPYRTDNLPPPDPAQYGALAAAITKGAAVRLIMEPGRLIAANAGILVSRVIYEKQGEQKTFLIVDAGMNDLVRPSMYGSYHEIIPLRQMSGRKILCDIVGPICESGDVFAHDRRIAPVPDGELLAMLSAGAYGYVMSSNYNVRPRAAEVMVKGKQWAVVQARETFEDLVQGASIPEFLQ